MSDLTKDLYEHQAAKCKSLCAIDHDRTSIDNPNLMPCVTCPFCKQTVDAFITPETIECPNCKVVVQKQ